ncbi:MAG: hypothetical protein ACOCRX_10975 [Candidatus Woesearchaeota archaeon]
MSYKKVCPNCGEISYSASNMGSWICPQCGYVIEKGDEENR